MNFDIVFTAKAEANFKDASKAYQEKILQETYTLKESITPDGKRIKRIKGVHFPLYRLRVGEYRILFTPLNKKVYILKIVHRKILERVIPRLKSPEN